MDHDDKLRAAVGNHVRAKADCEDCRKAYAASENRKVDADKALVAAIKASGRGGVSLDGYRYCIDGGTRGDHLVVSFFDDVVLSSTKPERKSL